MSNVCAGVSEDELNHEFSVEAYCLIIHNIVCECFIGDFWLEGQEKNHRVHGYGFCSCEVSA